MKLIALLLLAFSSIFFIGCGRSNYQPRENPFKDMSDAEKDRIFWERQKNYDWLKSEQYKKVELANKLHSNGKISQTKHQALTEHYRKQFDQEWKIWKEKRDKQVNQVLYEAQQRNRVNELENEVQYLKAENEKRQNNSIQDSIYRGMLHADWELQRTGQQRFINPHLFKP